MKFLDELASRRRFGMKPGLEAIRSVLSALGNPQRTFRAIHVAGTNGKGAVCAVLDAALRAVSGRSLRVGRYTSPHLVSLNERFFLDGIPVGDAELEDAASRVLAALSHPPAAAAAEFTFFEALTAAAFLIYSRAKVDFAVLECGLGGRLDATNVCEPALCVITRIGLDHCDWLGGTLEEIAAEKAGIVKPGVPVVLGRNDDCVRAVVEERARKAGAPFVYAPDVADEREIPSGFSLSGSFNRENAVTAIAAMKTLFGGDMPDGAADGFSRVAWPGRFQRVGDCLIDGAHNPPAAKALAASLSEAAGGDCPRRRYVLVFGACADKDVGEVLRTLAPFAARGLAVRTNNPRSLSAEDAAEMMRSAGIDAMPSPSLREALAVRRELYADDVSETLVCGSLFLAGEALVELGACPAPAGFDPSESLACSPGACGNVKHKTE